MKLHCIVYIYIYNIIIVSYNIDINTEWEYSSKLDQGWNTVDFNLPWNKAKIENIPTNGNSLYLRKLIPIHDVDTFSAFYSRFDILSGLVYYINGVEMGRVNLPAYIYIYYILL